MSITVMVHFPIPFDQLGAADPNADWMVELGVLAKEYGLTNQRYLLGEGEFYDFFEFESEDAYFRFKDASSDAISQWESQIGLGGDLKSKDKILRPVPPRP